MNQRPESFVKLLLDCNIMPTGTKVIFLGKDPLFCLEQFYNAAIENYKKEVLDSICKQRDLFEEEENDRISKSKGSEGI